jgi:hypothetical protein
VVLESKNFASLQPGTATFQNVDGVEAGMVDASLDWSSASNDINLYVTDNTCAGILAIQGGRCTVLARSDGPATKPERVTFNATGGENYSFWAHNNGRTPESGILEVGLTRSGGGTPAPAPTPTPTGNDPQAGLANGPVARLFIKVRSIQNTSNGNFRDPEQDAAGNWIVRKGDFVVYDGTQKNAGGQICKWQEDPDWELEDPDRIVSVRGSSNPFLLRTDIVRRGPFKVRAVVDGIESNELSMVAQ